MGPVTQNRRKRNFLSAIVKFSKKREKISPGAEVEISINFFSGKYVLKETFPLHALWPVFITVYQIMPAMQKHIHHDEEDDRGEIY